MSNIYIYRIYYIYIFIIPGLRFAMAQMKAAAVEIITKFNIRVNPKTRTDNLLEQFLFIANLRDGVHLDFELHQ